jgi:hypothetical protein
MQLSKKRIKQKVLEEYVKNPIKNPEKIAIELGCNLSWVNTVIDIYKDEINLKLPLYITKSIDLESIYYLFTETEEKKIEVVNRIISDTTLLTDYELFWLYNEKGFR